MYTDLALFIQNWKDESNGTIKLLSVLTDASLAKQVTPEGRSLGQIAWHITTTMEEMVSRTGLTFEAATETMPVPVHASRIVAAYKSTSDSMVKALEEHWTSETLLKTSDMYGQQWPNGQTLGILLTHQTHHRGQMTVLMRQAGLKVPGLCGPSKEEWAQFGMQEPAF